jgi:hypothetical protein
LRRVEEKKKIEIEKFVDKKLNLNLNKLINLFSAQDKEELL